jgi:hypothetical protein
MYDRREPFTHWLPALLTLIARQRENEGGSGARVINPELYDAADDGETDGLTEEQRAEVEEYGF